MLLLRTAAALALTRMKKSEVLVQKLDVEELRILLRYQLPFGIFWAQFCIGFTNENFDLGATSELIYLPAFFLADWLPRKSSS